MEDELLTTQEAAMEIGISKRQLERYLKSGDVASEHKKVGPGRVVRLSEARRFKEAYRLKKEKAKEPVNPARATVLEILRNSQAVELGTAALRGTRCRVYTIMSPSRIRELDLLATNIPTRTADGHTVQAVRSILGGGYVYTVGIETDDTGGV